MASKAKHIRAAETALGLELIGAETLPEAELRRKWERHFAPLGLALREERPPEDMWYRVQAALARSDDRNTIAKAKRGVWRWRFASLFMTAVAAGLAGFIFTKSFEQPSTPAPSTSQFVAVVTPEGDNRAMIVELDLAAGTARVRPVGVTVESGRDLQMWRVAPDSAPQSVGLVSAEGVTTFDLAANVGDTIAVSVEPIGGSTTGAPTGPVVFSGSLIAVPE